MFWWETKKYTQWLNPKFSFLASYYIKHNNICSWYICIRRMTQFQSLMKHKITECFAKFKQHQYKLILIQCYCLLFVVNNQKIWSFVSQTYFGRRQTDEPTPVSCFPLQSLFDMTDFSGDNVRAEVK